MKDYDRIITPDRTRWPSGPWDSESDAQTWRAGPQTVCHIRRAEAWWCGYVILEPGHPLHGAHADALDMDGADWCDVRDGDVWIGWDANHYGNAHPGRPDDGHYVTEREARARVEAMAEWVDSGGHDVVAILERSVMCWERAAEVSAGDSDWSRHHRERAIAGRALAAARLAEVTR